MKHLFSIVAALLLLAAPAAAQTIKSLGFNTTNGNIVAATNVVWTNAFNFSTNTVAAQVRTNLGLGWSALTNTNAANFRTDIGLGWSALTNTNAATSLLGYTSNGSVVAPAIAFTNNVTIHDIAFVTYGGGTTIQADGNDVWDISAGMFLGNIEFSVPVSFGDSNSKAGTRTNLGLGSGITTNRTFVANGVTNSVSISNGIITGWTQ